MEPTTAEAGSLLKELLGKPIGRVKAVEIENGPTVYVRPIPWGVICNLRETEQHGPEEMNRIVIHSLCDSKGVPLFPVINEQAFNHIASLPTPVVTQIADAALEVSAVDPAAAKKN